MEDFLYIILIAMSACKVINVRTYSQHLMTCFFSQRTFHCDSCNYNKSFPIIEIR